MKRKILIIAYHYPPDPISNPYPTASWVKHLPEFGWEPIILTRSPKAEAESMGEPNIHRTADRVSFPRLVSLRRSLSSSGWFFKLLNFLLINFLLYPDDKRGWFANAYQTGLSIASQQDFSLLLSVGTPWTDHWVAGVLSEKLSIPWIADYRDPWTQRTSTPYRGKWLLHQAISRVIEKRILARSVCCLHGSEVWADQLSALLSKRVFSLPNGYDRDDFSHMETQQPQGKPLTLAYVGTLHFPQRLEPFFEGFKLFVERFKLTEQDCKLHFVGTGEIPLLSEGFPSLTGYIHHFPYTSKREAIAQMVRSHILLLFQNEDTGWYPTKAFEYLACGNTILASPDNGGVINALLSQTGAGVVKHTPDQIAQWLGEKWEELCRWGKLNKASDRVSVEAYERRRLTGRLAEIFHKVSP